MRTVEDFTKLVVFCRGRGCRAGYSVGQFVRLFRRIESLYPREFLMWESLVLISPEVIEESDPELFCEWMAQEGPGDVE